MSLDRDPEVGMRPQHLRDFLQRRRRFGTNAIAIDVEQNPPRGDPTFGLVFVVEIGAPEGRATAFPRPRTRRSDGDSVMRGDQRGRAKNQGCGSRLAQAQYSAAALARICASAATDSSSTHSSAACAPAPVGPIVTVSMPAAPMNAASIQ